MMFPPIGLGLNSATNTISMDNFSKSNIFSRYDNGLSKMAFRGTSIVPSYDAVTNFQAREFSYLNYLPVMTHLGQNGLITLPAAFDNVNTTNIPTMSQLTNWGGNSGVGINPTTGAPVMGTPNGFIPPQVQQPGFPPAQPAFGPQPTFAPPPPGWGFAPPMGGFPPVMVAPPIMMPPGFTPGGFLPTFAGGFGGVQPVVMVAPPIIMPMGPMLN